MCLHPAALCLEPLLPRRCRHRNPSDQRVPSLSLKTWMQSPQVGQIWDLNGTGPLPEFVLAKPCVCGRSHWAKKCHSVSDCCVFVFLQVARLSPKEVHSTCWWECSTTCPPPTAASPHVCVEISEADASVLVLSSISEPRRKRKEMSDKQASCSDRMASQFIHSV